MIQMINETTYKARNRGTEWTLIRGQHGWTVYADNAQTRAWRFSCPKIFDSLEQVEQKYKAFRGISQIL